MIPTQTRAVDPFSSYESDNVNKLTRVLTDGEDKIVRDTGIVPTIDPGDDAIIRITDGVCVKDDLLIDLRSDTVGQEYQTLDITDVNNYVDGVLLSGPFPQSTYLVLSYQYIKHPNVNAAQLLILEDVSSFNTDLFMFLGRVVFSATTIISDIFLSDTTVVPNITRNVANLSDAYVDQNARDAIGNALLSTGTVQFIYDGTNISAIALSATGSRNTLITYNGIGIPVIHALGSFPVVQVIDREVGGANEGELVQAIVIHDSTNQFTVSFDPLQAIPHDFMIVY